MSEVSEGGVQCVHYQKIAKGVSEPSLPRCRKAPRHLEIGDSEPSFFFYTKGFYYFEALDLIISAISDRFDQPSYQIYITKVKNLIIKAASGHSFTEEFGAV